MSVNYDTLAPEYVNYRVADIRIDAAIRRHIVPGEKVLNVGAGQGSYEPKDCDVTAIEPSREMIARRAATKVEALQGSAECLPFHDNSFDTSLAVLTIHHWKDIQKGLSELKRVTRGKVIILTWNGDFGDFWLPDYLPEIATIDVELFPPVSQLSEWLGPKTNAEVLEIPYDCTDGFMCAYWRRPEMYLIPEARQAISTFSRIGDASSGLNSLRKDINTGHWHNQYESLLEKASLDCGYRLVVHEKSVA
ncbi:MAG: class I SAM-dependent methyltransferase [Pseudomonadales bacterium]|jgi:SAM-dependent methyltransferase|nr:class I SAM-dependent methyltransferase [Pseudomonadales bacterium]|tara:strand:- start:181 stop:927 length:747 start_codon:yes stop_codon:yes gene_type:complete